MQKLKYPNFIAISVAFMKDITGKANLYSSMETLMPKLVSSDTTLTFSSEITVVAFEIAMEITLQNS